MNSAAKMLNGVALWGFSALFWIERGALPRADTGLARWADEHHQHENRN